MSVHKIRVEVPDPANHGFYTYRFANVSFSVVDRGTVPIDELTVQLWRWEVIGGDQNSKNETFTSIALAKTHAADMLQGQFVD